MILTVAHGRRRRFRILMVLCGTKKCIDTADIVNEDIYRLTRTVRIDEDEKHDWFTVDVGSGNDPRFAPYTCGAAFVSFDMLNVKISWAL